MAQGNFLNKASFPSPSHLLYSTVFPPNKPVMLKFCYQSVLLREPKLGQNGKEDLGKQGNGEWKTLQEERKPGGYHLHRRKKKCYVHVHQSLL